MASCGIVHIVRPAGLPWARTKKNKKYLSSSVVGGFTREGNIRHSQGSESIRVWSTGIGGRGQVIASKMAVSIGGLVGNRLVGVGDIEIPGRHFASFRLIGVAKIVANWFQSSKVVVHFDCNLRVHVKVPDSRNYSIIRIVQMFNGQKEVFRPGVHTALVVLAYSSIVRSKG